MQSKLMLIPVELDDLIGQLREVIKEEIQAQHRLDGVEEKLLSPKEACQLFQPKISLPTLAKWEKDGRIPCHRLGGRIYYKKSEVIGSLETLKKYSKGL
jgi:hypothetical protein